MPRFVYIYLIVYYILTDRVRYFRYVYSIVDIDQILSNKVPKTKDVLALLMPIKDKWYTIGISLEVDTGELNFLKTSNNTAETNLLMVIGKWLEQNASEATWNVLLKEVEGPIIKNHQIGDDIRTFLKRPDVYNKYVFAGCNPFVSECIIIYLLLVYM